jgi:N-acyl-D-amino-acid deacylase
MRTQEKDGSWHVQTRAFGFQPYFESGFPHGYDQWISMAATAWSAMALMPVADHTDIRAAR